MSDEHECPICGEPRPVMIYDVKHEYGAWQCGWFCWHCGEAFFTMDGAAWVPKEDRYEANERPNLEVVP
jgi:hypothetical protein